MYGNVKPFNKYKERYKDFHKTQVNIQLIIKQNLNFMNIPQFSM